METAITAALCRQPGSVHWKNEEEQRGELEREEEKQECNSNKREKKNNKKNGQKKKKDVYVSVIILQKDEGFKVQQIEEPHHLQCHPTWDEALEELKSIAKISGPTALSTLLLYLRSMVSMLFLGHLGDLQLAAGSLSLGFANITAHSILTGLSMGMEPICGQAFGAKRWSLIALTLLKTILILLCASLPIGLIWLSMERFMLWCGQDHEVTSLASTFIIFSLPDLLAQAILHPLKIYLRVQNETLALATCAAISLSLHIPINFFLVFGLGLGLKGVALSSIWTNFNLVFLLLLYVCKNGAHGPTFHGLRPMDCFTNWKPLLQLAIPSCASVCLEWWWYELMILLCGLLSEPQPKVAAMGVLIQTTSLLYILPSSLSLGISTRVSHELGADNPTSARRATIVGLMGSALLGLFSMGFATSVLHVWGLMFTRERSILRLISQALPIIGLCELFNCPQTSGCGLLRGCARPGLGAYINLGSFYLLGLPVAVSLAFFLGLGFVGLWLGLLTAEACCLLLMLLALVNTDWTAQAARANSLTGSETEPLILEGEDRVNFA
ncbi:protein DETOXIFICATION 49 [Amborella trichopoda]|uniref:Protein DETOXIFICATION n=1 Tax=Amborella trichopoda TaxID=13333 RepID=W1PIM0_AMBTC|nr:protein DETOXIFICATION 49 [Amborella trichopoda]ERN07476.1 hypothetical protein AMTR_s00019p00255670 [Amborella trichopoda]|eukprot:XP_006845801.1 protein DETOXIFICATION 49 [Amborella trichopoda]